VICHPLRVSNTIFIREDVEMKIAPYAAVALAIGLTIFVFSGVIQF
jgi:hypothetical protein